MEESQRKTSSLCLWIIYIHPDIGNKDLKDIFQRIGGVKDIFIFISRKKRTNNKKQFGFVRFGDRRVAVEE